MNFVEKLYMFKIKQNLSVLFALLFIPLIILFSFNLFVFNESYYDKKFLKNKVYDQYEKEEVSNAVNALFDYFKSENEVKTSFFNDKEKEHLKDVKEIIQKARNIFYFVLFIFSILIIYFLVQKKYFELGKMLLFGGIFSLAVILILSSSLIFFSSSFYLFHTTFFQNNLWLLNPQTDNLINIFPEQFFFDITKDILIVSFLISVLVLVKGIFLIRYYKKQPISSDKRSKE